MSLSLNKGEKVALTKDHPTLSLGEAGLGWDQLHGAATADLDAFMVEINDAGRAANGEASLIYYGHKSNANKSVYVGEDNLTGEGEGYDEHGYVKFSEVPSNVKEVIVAVSIYQWREKNQNFGQISNAKCDVLDSVTQKVLASYDLSEDMSNFTGIIVGKFRRESDGQWSFKAIGEGVKGGMVEIINRYGLSA
jgi:tellurium resistance protein TerD